MKKTIYIIMALIVAFCTNLFATSVSTTVSAAEANTAVVAYDLNNDGVVNAIDLAILKQYLIKEGGETSSYHIADAVKLKKFLLGDLETSGEKPAKPAVRYSFTNSVTDEEIWFVRNQLTNTENTSITYSSGHMVIENEMEIMYIEITEDNHSQVRAENTIVTVVTDSGETIYVFLDENSCLKVKTDNTYMIKPAELLKVTAMKPTEENEARLLSIFASGEIKKVWTNVDEVTLMFETKDAEMYLEFERGTDEIDPSGNTFVIIASAQFVKVDTNTTITYQLFKNANGGFSLGAVA